MSTLTPSGNPRSKAAFAAELVDNLNTPASHWDGLTALHWLGLNPLVRLGAPSVYSGPSCPPSPSRPTTPLPTDDLNRAISNAVARSTLPLAQGMMALSGSIEVMQAQMTRLVDMVTDLHNRPLPSIPPPSPILIDEDTLMPPPPPPAPAAAPATTPVPASTPHAKKQPHAKTPTPAAAPSAKAPIPTPPAKPTPPPHSSFASAVKLPARPSLVVTPLPCCRELVTHLNSVLLEGGHAVTLSAARWTAKANLVLTTGPDTTAHHLNTASHTISEALAVYLGLMAGRTLFAFGHSGELKLVEGETPWQRGQAIYSPFNLTPITFPTSRTHFPTRTLVTRYTTPTSPLLFRMYLGPSGRVLTITPLPPAFISLSLIYVDWVLTYSRPYCIELPI
ncbi:hypothetical protein EDB87DRAFT_1582568 [Lactarius vividus]|nr:hypothetical protein EDB87DRAFT_1582568 [Lactarius vividus]